MEREVTVEEQDRTAPALLAYREDVQQCVNMLKSNEPNYRRRWIGFRTANEPNYKNTVKVLGFVGISDPRTTRPWRRVGSEGSAPGQFKGPVGLDVDVTRNQIAISDFENHRIQVKQSDMYMLPVCPC